MTLANRNGNTRRLQPPGREPASARFRQIGEANGTPCHFEVFRTDEVRMTSLHFEGGDWHWRLCDESGTVLVEAGGYSTEPKCRAAIAVLKDRAAQAAVCPSA